jgi:hypothetical protein
MRDDLLPVSWRPRLAPLDPVGVAARGEAARAMAKRLLARDEEALSRLSGVSGPGLSILLGDAPALPWVEGAAYLGRDAHAPSLLLPTNREPTVPLPLLERALLIRATRLHAEPPFAVLLDPPLLASTLEARPLIRSQIQAWLETPGRMEEMG